MHPKARALADQLYKSPHELRVLHALRRELKSSGHVKELANVLEWWAQFAPDDESASEALYEAAKILIQSVPDHPHVFAILMAALKKDPAREAVAHLLRDHLIAAADPHELEQVFTEWALAVRRDGGTNTLAALSSFMLAHVRLHQRGDLDGAISALEDTLRAFPQHLQAKRMLAEQYERRASTPASSDKMRSREDEHRAAQLLYELGSFETGETAINLLLRALDLVPGHSGALEELLDRVGRTRLELRIERLSAYVEAAPDRARTHKHRFELVRALFRQRRHEEAVPHLRLLAGRGYGEARSVLERLDPPEIGATVSEPAPDRLVAEPLALVPDMGPEPDLEPDADTVLLEENPLVTRRESGSRPQRLALIQPPPVPAELLVSARKGAWIEHGALQPVQRTNDELAASARHVLQELTDYMECPNDDWEEEPTSRDLSHSARLIAAERSGMRSACSPPPAPSFVLQPAKPISC
jgi:tetratricopeptide (TPR) repeat protein